MLFLGDCGTLETVIYLTETDVCMGLESGVNFWLLPSSFCFEVLQDVEKAAPNVLLPLVELLQPFSVLYRDELMSPETVSQNQIPFFFGTSVKYFVAALRTQKYNSNNKKMC